MYEETDTCALIAFWCLGTAFAILSVAFWFTAAIAALQGAAG